MPKASAFVFHVLNLHDGSRFVQDKDEQHLGRHVGFRKFEVFSYNLATLGNSVFQGVPQLVITLVNELLGASSSFGSPSSIVSVVSTGIALCTNLGPIANYVRKEGWVQMLHTDHFGFGDAVKGVVGQEDGDIVDVVAAGES